MKRKLCTSAIVIVCGLVLLTVGTPFGNPPVPDDVMIDNKGYAADKKGPVKLTHKKHAQDYKVACTECHHEFKDGKNVWKEGDAVQKCSACHDPEAKKDNADKLQNAYHKNCQGCHKQLQGKDAPHKKCNDCHEKKG